MANSILRRKNTALKRRKMHIRNRLKGTSERPRLVVFKSLRYIYAQIINDEIGKTLVSCSSLSKELDLDPKLKKTESSFKIGMKLGEKALAAGITTVCFDRNGKKYHGRIKALADGARKAGLVF